MRLRVVLKILSAMFLSLQFECLGAQDLLDTKRITFWSKQLQTSITKTFDDVITLVDYSNSGLESKILVDKDIVELRNNAFSKLKSIVIKKQQIVNAITVKAEELNFEFSKSQNNSLYVPYIKAKNIGNSNDSLIECNIPSYIELNSDSRFWNIPINRQQSTVHIPTNVFDCSNVIKHVAVWTNDLDKIFINNQQNLDKTLKWQYFASQTGFFKIFPGIEWQLSLSSLTSETVTSRAVDFFDCRNQDWYILAMAYPKDIVILLDNSGSMRGLRQIIANDTVSKILNTLSENDFFNIILLNANVSYIDASYNQTLIQATQMNIDRTMQQLSMNPYGMADYEKGYTEAFNLLQMAKNARNYSNGDMNSANCNQAIMVIADTITEPFTDLLNRLNFEKDIRIFTYLVGVDSSDLQTAKVLSCSNRGLSAQISTLADVREKVDYYLPVVARANALKGHHFFIWTGIHSNQMNAKGSDDSAMMEMFISVAQSVYERSEKSTNYSSGVLLGVAGTDVPVNDFVRTLPDYKLGVFAYFFGITNNGYVLFHPEFKATYINSDQKLSLRPYYNFVDISSIEYPADTVLQNEPLLDLELDELMQAEELRRNLISSIEGTSTMLRKFMIAENTRSYQQKMKYFFAQLISPEALNLSNVEKTDVMATSFSIAVAFPWSNSTFSDIKKLIYPNRTELDNELTDNDLKMKVDLCTNSSAIDCKGYYHTISNYEFCDFVSETHSTMFRNQPIKLLGELLALSKVKRSTINCDEEYLQRIYTDAEVSKKFRVATNTELKNNVLGIEFIFFVSNTGLVRWNQRENLTLDHKEFVSELRQATRSEHYRRTANLNREYPNMLVFTGPTEAAVNMPQRAKPVELESLSVTATRILHLVQTNGDADVLAPVGMLGYRVPYSSFRKMFLEDANVCLDKNRCLNCSLENVGCYLVDNDAYVVVSKKSSDIGKPFDAIQCNVTQDLIKRRVFETTIGFDFQAICKYTPTRPKSASRLLDPVSWFINAIFRFIYHLTLFFAQFSFSSMYHAFIAEANYWWLVPSDINTSDMSNVLLWQPPGNCSRYQLLQKGNSFNNAQIHTGNISCSSITSPLNCNSIKWIAQRIQNTNLLIIAIDNENTECLSCSYSCAKVVGRINVETQPRKDNTTFRWNAFRQQPPWGCNQVTKSTVNAGVCNLGVNQIRQANLFLTFGCLIVLYILITMSEKTFQ